MLPPMPGIPGIAIGGIAAGVAAGAAPPPETEGKPDDRGAALGDENVPACGACAPPIGEDCCGCPLTDGNGEDCCCCGWPLTEGNGDCPNAAVAASSAAAEVRDRRRIFKRNPPAEPSRRFLRLMGGAHNRENPATRRQSGRFNLCGVAFGEQDGLKGRHAAAHFSLRSP
jgi:hypothetical protein